MPRPRVLVFQHVPYEPLGTLDPLLKERGCRLRYVNFGREPESRPRLAGYDALIALGGPMNADQISTFPNLLTEMDILREAVARNMPVLGICLGAQLLAKAAGGDVSRNAFREIGWYDVTLTDTGLADPVLQVFGPEREVFQWHEDGIALPPAGECLARSALSEVQAFRIGANAYGFQFHLEVNRPLIERWLTVEAHAAVLAEERGRIDPAAIRRRSDEAVQALAALSRATFSRWIDLFDDGRRLQLPSR